MTDLSQLPERDLIALIENLYMYNGTPFGLLFRSPGGSQNVCHIMSARDQGLFLDDRIPESLDIHSEEWLQEMLEEDERIAPTAETIEVLDDTQSTSMKDKRCLFELGIKVLGLRLQQGTYIGVNPSPPCQTPVPLADARYAWFSALKPYITKRGRVNSDDPGDLMLTMQPQTHAHQDAVALTITNLRIPLPIGITLSVLEKLPETEQASFVLSLYVYQSSPFPSLFKRDGFRMTAAEVMYERDLVLCDNHLIPDALQLDEESFRQQVAVELDRAQPISDSIKLRHESARARRAALRLEEAVDCPDEIYSKELSIPDDVNIGHPEHSLSSDFLPSNADADAAADPEK
ncbi:hypothetical protein M231_03801 [Tremella mesenterica]|uniref:Uncharacterized protein n=1 Tax=Tremella mesenterica TaxID=5217 RepID=A0A4Q1BMC4_TREME|nr:hypothetical protein M231_03801 [Tremella mesenterica]